MAHSKFIKIFICSRQGTNYILQFCSN